MLDHGFAIPGEDGQTNKEQPQDDEEEDDSVTVEEEEEDEKGELELGLELEDDS